MKKFITVLAAIILMSISLHAQSVDTRVVTGDCTIIKEISTLKIPQLGFSNYMVLKEDADGPVTVKIEWHAVGDGGRCTLSITLPSGTTAEIETWRNYDDLKLIRTKTPEGNYNYMLANSMFGYFALLYLPPETAALDENVREGYVLDTELYELD